MLSAASNRSNDVTRSTVACARLTERTRRRVVASAKTNTGRPRRVGASAWISCSRSRSGVAVTGSESIVLSWFKATFLPPRVCVPSRPASGDLSTAALLHDSMSNVGRYGARLQRGARAECESRDHRSLPTSCGIDHSPCGAGDGRLCHCRGNRDAGGARNRRCDQHLQGKTRWGERARAEVLSECRCGRSVVGRETASPTAKRRAEGGGRTPSGGRTSSGHGEQLLRHVTQWRQEYEPLDTVSSVRTAFM